MKSSLGRVSRFCTWSWVVGLSLALAVAAVAGCEQGRAQSSTSGPASTTATLAQAIRDGLVSATFTGVGASSGDVIKVRVARLRGSGRLRLTIAPGSMLRSANAAVQNMVILEVRGRDLGDGMYSPEASIELTDNRPVTYSLSAMCADFERDNPSEQTTFSLYEPEDPVLACIAREAAGNTAVASAQAAVWLHRDGLTYAGMSERFDVSPAEWTAGQAIFRSCALIR